METRLKRIDGDWESWTEGVSSFLRRDEGQTIYWTVCDLADAPFLRWTLQIECEGVLEQSLTFVAANESVTGARAKPWSRDERVLLDASGAVGPQLSVLAPPACRMGAGCPRSAAAV